MPLPPANARAAAPRALRRRRPRVTGEFSYYFCVATSRWAFAAALRKILGQKEFHYRWEYELSASPASLWPAVADTNRFNRDAGVPALKSVAFADPGNGERTGPKARRLRLSKLGLNVEWEEEPFEWVRPHRFGVVRRYRGGPVAEMRVVAELNEREGGGTLLVYEVWAKPRGALGRAAIPLQIGRISARRFADTFRRYDEKAGLETLASGPLSVAHLDMGERALLASL